MLLASPIYLYNHSSNIFQASHLVIRLLTTERGHAVMCIFYCNEDATSHPSFLKEPNPK